MYLNLSNNPLFKKADTTQYFLFINLNNLQNLNISHTGLRIFPYFLENLENLQNLDISQNPIKKIPENQNGFKTLKILNLYETKIKEVPAKFKASSSWW